MSNSSINTSRPLLNSLSTKPGEGQCLVFELGALLPMVVYPLESSVRMGLTSKHLIP